MKLEELKNWAYRAKQQKEYIENSVGFTVHLIDHEGQLIEKAWREANQGELAKYFGSYRDKNSACKFKMIPKQGKLTHVATEHLNECFSMKYWLLTLNDEEGLILSQTIIIGGESEPPMVKKIDELSEEILIKLAEIL